VASIRRLDRRAGNLPRGKNPMTGSEGGESTTWRESDDWIGGQGIRYVVSICWLNRRAGNPLRGEHLSAKSEGRESATWRASVG
jgi:hypothetical protein